MPGTVPSSPRAEVAVSDATVRLRRIERRLDALADLVRTDPRCADESTREQIAQAALTLVEASRAGAARCRPVADRALTLAEQVEDAGYGRLLAAAGLDLRSWALLALDQVDDAASAAAEAEELVEAGLPEGRDGETVTVRVHCAVAAVAAELEDFESALLHLTTALELDSAHDLGSASAIHANIAMLLLGVGEAALGLPYLDRALEAAAGDEARLAELLELRAELLTELGDTSTAMRSATAAAEHAERSGLPPARFRRRMATVRVALGDHRAVADLQAIAADEQAAGGLGLDTALCLGRALVATDRPQQAVEVLEPFRDDDGLAPLRRDDITDVLVAAYRSTGALGEAVDLLVRQRDRRREAARLAATARVLDVSRRLDVALLEGDLAIARAREADLRRLVRQRTEELSWRARHDQLTGLLNRDAVAAHVAEPAGECWRTVAFADLDRFKVVNDAHGHAVGDTVLVALAGRLSGAVSVLQGSCRLARTTADQFVVVADTPGPLNPEDLARVIRDALAARIEVGGIGELRMSVSIGIAQSAPAQLDAGTPDDPFTRAADILPRSLHADLAPRSAGLLGGEGLELDLLRDAEVALHRAKVEGGGGTCVFGEGDLLAVVRRFEVEHALRNALSQGRVTAGYDPIVDLRTGAVVGVEALARLDTGSRRVVAGEFIDIAEETGLVDDIGEAVSRVALTDLAATTREWFVALNLGAGEMRRADLVDELESRARAAGVPLERVVIEVTERSFVDVASTEANVLLELSRRGVGLAIDDFSTGHSSMVHMSWMPLSLLKIDRSLVIRAAYSSSDRILVSAVVSMAGALGLKVVAEGVESPELYAIVRELGCDYAQGHLFGEYATIVDIPDVFEVDEHVELPEVTVDDAPLRAPGPEPEAAAGAASPMPGTEPVVGIRGRTDASVTKLPRAVAE